MKILYLTLKEIYISDLFKHSKISPKPYAISWHDFIWFSDIIILLIIVCSFLIRAAMIKNDEHKRWWFVKWQIKAIEYWLYALFFVSITFICFDITPQFWTGNFWSINFAGPLLFNMHLIVDRFTWFFKLLIVCTMLFVYRGSYVFIRWHKNVLLIYPILLLLSTIFLFLLTSCFDLISMFLCIMGFTLCLYILLFYANTPGCREAASKYFYLSAFSSGVILIGIILTYFVLQTTNFFQIRFQIYYHLGSYTLNFSMLATSIQLLVIGFLFKLSAFPCHLWTPEVYDGSPDPITAFLMLPVKVATLGIFFRILAYAYGYWVIIPMWQYLIVIASLGSMIWGCFGAMLERGSKRFIAYTSINQMGFLLLGIACGGIEAYIATFYYLIIYLMMTMGFFYIFLTTYKIDNETQMQMPLTHLNDLNYVSEKYIVYSFAMIIILFSMIGIPPLAGFFGKYLLLLNALKYKQYSLVIIGLITSLISAYYYLDIIRTMWFGENISKNKESFTINLEDNEIDRWVLFILVSWLILLFIINPYLLAFVTKIIIVGYQVCVII